MQEETNWDTWVKEMHNVGEIGGEHGHKHRIIEETMAWQMRKE